jgi:CRISPR-associated protein Cas2
MDHLYVVCYDIRDPKRWRKVFRKMKGYGEWLQLSVFQCRLDKVRVLMMEDDIRSIVNQKEDHVIIVDMGPADAIRPKVRSLGKAFEPVERRAVIV